MCQKLVQPFENLDMPLDCMGSELKSMPQMEVFCANAQQPLEFGCDLLRLFFKWRALCNSGWHDTA